MGGSRSPLKQNTFCDPALEPWPLILPRSIAQLTDLSAKFKRILTLSLPPSSPNFAAVNIEDYDFGSWLADVLPPMRPLVWSLVLKIFARFLEKGHCEREFDAALLTAHTLPIETLKQIEVNDCHIVPVEQLERAQHTRHFTFTCSQADLSRCHAVDALIGSSRFQCCNVICNRLLMFSTAAASSYLKCCCPFSSSNRNTVIFRAWTPLLQFASSYFTPHLRALCCC